MKLKVDPETLDEMIGTVGSLLGTDAKDVFLLAADRAEGLTKAQELDYMLECAKFCRYRYLHAVKPNGLIETLVVELAEASLNQDAHLEEWRRRAASLLMQLAVMIQPTAQQAALVLYEQIKLFNTWYEADIRKEVQDV
jgi:hypothetical protein